MKLDICIYGTPSDWTHATYMNICYDVTYRMKSTHEISYNLMQRNTPGLVDSIFKIHSDKWLAGSIAQYLFTYEISYITTFSDSHNQPSGGMLAAIPRNND